MVRKGGRKFQPLAPVVMRRAPIFEEYVSDDLLELGLISRQHSYFKYLAE